MATTDRDVYGNWGSAAGTAGTSAQGKSKKPTLKGSPREENPTWRIPMAPLPSTSNKNTTPPSTPPPTPNPNPDPGNTAPAPSLTGDNSLDPKDWSDKKLRAEDSVFNLQLNALERALGAYEADYDKNLARYDTDYNDALGVLGFLGDDKGWSFSDPLTSSGRMFSNTLNDFASRGMLQSSAYDSANLRNSDQLSKQLGEMGRAQERYLADQGDSLSRFRESNTNDRNLAREEALMRLAATMGL